MSTERKVTDRGDREELGTRGDPIRPAPSNTHSSLAAPKIQLLPQWEPQGGGEHHLPIALAFATAGEDKMKQLKPGPGVGPRHLSLLLRDRHYKSRDKFCGP